MPFAERELGREGVVVVTVDHELSADRYGNPGLEALATPALLGLFEQASMRALEGIVGTGERSVGGSVELHHVAPTPVGAEVTVRARLTGMSGRELRFELEASDGHEQIARGKHSRFLVDETKLARRLARKAR